MLALMGGKVGIPNAMTGRMQAVIGDIFTGLAAGAQARCSVSDFTTRKVA